MMDHRGTDDESRRELALQRYIHAIDTADLETLMSVLREAQADPELDRQIAAVNEALHDEAGLGDLEHDAVIVRSLLLRHMPTAAVPEQVDIGPTVGTVAARIEGNSFLLQQLLPPDRLVNRGLLGSSVALPTLATAESILQLAQDLNIAASERYWELFRRESVVAAMSHSAAGLRLAAARKESRSRKRSRAKRRKDTTP